ncbi:MAG: DUF935 family protein [Verrucomicrobiota bacterium]
MIRELLTRLFKPIAAAEVPQKQTTILRLEGVPQALAQDMSADRIQQILRATESGQADDYLALIRDIVTGDTNVLADFTQRKTRLLSKPWRMESEDAKDPRADRNDVFCQAQLKGVPGLIPALSHLLDGSLWPVAVVEKVYAPGTEPGVRYRLVKLVPVPHHLLDFRQGKLWIKVTTEEGMPTGTVVEADPVRYIVHRGHLLQSLPDCWGGPARALLFWWFIGASARGWWAQGVERNGVPFLVGKYDTANPGDKSTMLSAFRAAARTFGLAISRETQVEVFKDMASGDAGVHQRLLEFAQSQMSRLVVGQTMTTKAQAGGLGGTQADVQNDVLTDIVQFDAMLLGGTLDDQLLKPLLDLNGLDGPVPALGWQITTEDAKGVAEVLGMLKTAGISLKPEGEATLSGAVGLPVRIDGAAPAVTGAPEPGGPPPSGPKPPPDVQPSQLALNGAQITALSDLVNKVAMGQLPYDSALNTARAAFPDLSEPVLQGIFSPVRTFRIAAAPATLKADGRPVPETGTPAQDACDAIAAAGAATLSQAFRGSLAPVRQIIRESTSAEDLQRRLALFYADLPVGRLAALTEEALAACAGNAAAGFRV